MRMPWLYISHCMDPTTISTLLLSLVRSVESTTTWEKKSRLRIVWGFARRFCRSCTAHRTPTINISKVYKNLYDFIKNMILFKNVRQWYHKPQRARLLETNDFRLQILLCFIIDDDHRFFYLCWSPSIIHNLVTGLETYVCFLWFLIYLFRIN